MCGIVVHCGDFVNREQCHKALNAMERRGPDSAGEWIDQDRKIYLGHRRLSIVDLSERGNQPLKNEDGTIFLIANGEIYNYFELRKSLESLGHQFFSDSDCECIIHGYEEWGNGIVDRLEGMFAFALWDDRKKSLLAARDAFGQKPLFLRRDGNSFQLGSTIDCLLSFLPGKPTLNLNAVAQVLAYGYILEPHTIWEEIERVPPGHLLTWSKDSGIKIQEYYSPPSECEESPDESWLEELFPYVCKQHLMADVPLAVFLSAGVDSTAVASTVSRLGAEVTALTVGFSKSDKDESVQAKEIADYLRIPHQVIQGGDRPVLDKLKEIYAYVDEPMVRSGIISNWLISKNVSKFYKVALSGHGGDELFGGYKWYNRNPFLSGKKIKPKTSVFSWFSQKETTETLKNQSILHAHAFNTFGRFLPNEITRILAPGNVRFSSEEFIKPFEKHFRKDLPLKRALQRIDLMTFCSDSSLPKVDSASMGHSLEVRCPFLDRRMVDKALRMPLKAGENSDISKQILRNYLKKTGAPEPSKNKNGFSYKIFETLDQKMTDKLSNDSFFVKENIFSKDWKRILAKSEERESNKLWVFINLAVWAEAQKAKGYL